MWKMKIRITETLQIRFSIDVLILGSLNSGISLYCVNLTMCNRDHLGIFVLFQLNQLWVSVRIALSRHKI